MTISRAAAVIAVVAAMGAAGPMSAAAGPPAYGPAGHGTGHEAGHEAATRASGPVTAPIVPEPNWFTDAVASQAWAAAQLGAAIPLPDDADIPTSSLLFPGIRPGSRMVSPSGCTLNYVFGTGASLSIGTAGHCAKVGQDVTVVSAPGVLMNIGTTVSSVAKGIGNDFALIRIRPQMRRYVSASMSYVGGPTGQVTPKTGDAVVYAGHGLVVGYGGTPRAGVVSYRTGTGFGWVGVANPGDSGAPVRLLDGRAAGGLTHVIVDPTALPTTIAGTTIARMQQSAGLPMTRASAMPEATPPIPVRRCAPVW